MATLPTSPAFAGATWLQREADRINRIQFDASRQAVDQARYWDRIGGSGVVAGANALAAIAGGAERERGDIARFLEASDAVRRAGIGQFADVSSLANVNNEIAGGVHASEMLQLASHSADVARARDQFAGDGLTRTAAQVMGATVSDMFKDATGKVGVSAGLRGIVGMEATRPDAQFQALLGNFPSSLDAMLASIRDAVPSWQSRADAYAAYGPFVHREREPPWGRWYEPADYSTEERPDASPEPFEKNEAGIYVPTKRGRPAGSSLIAKTRFLSELDGFVQREGYFPSMGEFTEFLSTYGGRLATYHVSTLKNNLKSWGLEWKVMRAAAMN